MHVWVALPAEIGDPALLASYDALMLDEERRRQRAFVFERNRLEFLITRALVRTVLSRYRPTSPHDWRFRNNAYGRPEIDPACGLRFNLSNHPSMVVCAVREGGEVGIDVEPLSRSGDVLKLAETVFAPRELAELEALEGHAQADRALSLWTSKEAYIKARGMGLSLPLPKFAFRFDDPAAPTIAFDPTLDDNAQRWSFSIRDVAEHRIALAVETWQRPVTVEVRRWVPTPG